MNISTLTLSTVKNKIQNMKLAKISYDSYCEKNNKGRNKNNYKNVYCVKDGFIIYKIDTLGRVECQCSTFKTTKLCFHVLWVFTYHFNLSDNSIFFLLVPRYQTGILNVLHDNKKNANVSVDKHICEMVADIECGICLNNITMKDYYMCSHCHNIVHQTCMNKWLSTPNHEKVCVYCKQ